MMDEITEKILKGEIDINNQELFVSALFKAFLYKMDNQVYLRRQKIPHFMLNTGDDIMYLEHKGQDQSKEIKQQPNEDYIYNKIPRSIANLETIEVLEDQVTSPYIRGNFELETKEQLIGFTGEFRRMPLKINVSLKYYLDSFTDVMEVTQHIMSKMLFIQSYKFSYMGQTMQASYKVPTSFNNEKNITFDGGTTEQKVRTIELSMEIETNMPIFDPRTAIRSDKYIQHTIETIKIGQNDIIASTNKTWKSS